MSVLTIQQAIKEALSDDGLITKYEAKVLRELVLADNVVSDEERLHLQTAVDSNCLDDTATEILTGLLRRFTQTSYTSEVGCDTGSSP